MLPLLGNQRKRPQSTTSSPASSRKSSSRHSVNQRQSRVSSIRDEEVADVIEPLESTATSHPRPKRSELQKSLCKSRGNTRCVVTQMPEVVEIAHIYPHSMSSLPDHGIVWDLLRVFWSDERIQQWKAAVFTENTTEFFWLRKYPRRPHQSITTRPELPASLDGDMTNMKLFSCETEENIHSGTILTLHTDDPETKPLPSTALLEMQWILHRLTALSGAADIFFSEFDQYGDSSDASFDLGVSDESSLREGYSRWGDGSDGSPDSDIPAEKDVMKGDVTMENSQANTGFEPTLSTEAVF
ncbi:hypothetical protein AJ79_08625 [Helicocarpus griseus UAMH5409]|uniref:HNH nuclease domain-containing protein n=1 Tax=Helicocarpus griseus UAMH5409 TaxID=1447875 RepID=A0A2B7WIN0_9EURO|nr:hypothetical protein AJ79_08625 [Helicocarpus griseus UAMH5409]